MLAGSTRSCARWPASVWPLAWSTITQAVASSVGGGGTGGVSAWATAQATASRQAVRILKVGLAGWMGRAILLQGEPRRFRSGGAQALDQGVEFADVCDRTRAHAEQPAAV